MKNVILKIFIPFLLGLMFSCNSEINGDDVIFDKKKFVYQFKDGSGKVSGKIVFYKVDSVSKGQYKSSECETENGVVIGTEIGYYPSGAKWYEIPNINGLRNGAGKYYYESGNIWGITEYVDEKIDGVQKEFSDQGVQIKESIYKNDSLIREYEFSYGEKIIPAIEKLELIEMECGYYDDYGYGSSALIRPMILMKWKNISDKALTKNIKVEAIFIKGDEEFGTDMEYLSSWADPPLQSGLTRQISLKSDVGFTGAYPINSGTANVKCKILIDKQVFKIIEIKNDYLYHNRIQ